MKLSIILLVVVSIVYSQDSLKSNSRNDQLFRDDLSIVISSDGKFQTTTGILGILGSSTTFIISVSNESSMKSVGITTSISSLIFSIWQTSVGIKKIKMAKKIQKGNYNPNYFKKIVEEDFEVNNSYWE